jgi:hypothetical protein
MLPPAAYAANLILGSIMNMRFINWSSPLLMDSLLSFLAFSSSQLEILFHQCPSWNYSLWLESVGLVASPFFWYNSHTHCRQCAWKETHWPGVICGNFGQPVIGLLECQSGWCATCYAMAPGDGFWIYHNVDGDGNPLIVAGEEKHFLEGRSGDHFSVPFIARIVHSIS